jgi:hypothetical protein
MPIYPLLHEGVFNPDECQAMGIAFEGVLQELGLKDRADPLCTLIALEIIKLGQQGITDPSVSGL